MKKGNWRVRQLEEGMRKHCRKWELAVRTNDRYANGRRKWSRLRFSGTYTEACAEARRLADGYADGSMAAPSRWTFDSWAGHVNDAKLSAGAITENTHSKNESMRANYRLHIGGVPIGELTPTMVDDAHVELRNGGSVSGKPLCGTTLAMMHTYGWGLMDRAVKEGLAARNPFDLAVRPKPDTAERKALDLASEVELVLSLDPRDRHHIAIMLTLEAGLRRGECCALRWSDVAGGMLSISKSMHADGEDYPTKTGKVRCVPLSSTLAEALETRKSYQAFRMRIHGGEQVDSTHVLSDDFGTPLLPLGLTRWWARHRADFGLDDWTIHEFRHTFCTNLAESDVHPKVMQQLMGHASERTSMRVYTHVHDAQLFAAMASMDAAKSGHDTTLTQHG